MVAAEDVGDAMILLPSVTALPPRPRLAAAAITSSQPFLSVNYGEVADNLPPPAATARFLESTTISKVQLYNADPAMIKALLGSNISLVIGTSSADVASLVISTSNADPAMIQALSGSNISLVIGTSNVDPARIQALSGSNISLVIGTSNADVASLASSPSAASQWLSANLIAPASVSTISVGNEVLNSGDPTLYSQLLPAMQNLHAALPAGSGVKISTVHSMAVMSASDPPSSGAFHADLAQYLNPILQFLMENGGPFMINPYPYFAYRDDPRPETLAFCLFQPNLGRLDPGTKITYMNMFDAQVDAIKSALNSAGFGNVEIVVAETGWPYKGDDGEVGATVENAAAYNGNLVKHLKTMIGTPLMPGKSVDTYIFELYDEDLKPGPTSERSFGLYQLDSTMIYDVGLAKSSSPQVNPPVNPPAPAAIVSPAKPQPSTDCRLGNNGANCNVPTYIPSSVPSVVPSSVGSALRANLVYQTSATLTLNQFFRSIFSRTLEFSLSFTFYALLPLLLLS